MFQLTAPRLDGGSALHPTMPCLARSGSGGVLEYVFTWERMHARSCGRIVIALGAWQGRWLRHWHCSRVSSSILGCLSGREWAGVVTSRPGQAWHVIDICKWDEIIKAR